MNFNKDYLESIINTASREQLMLMLFDGAIRFVHQGRQAIEDKNWEKASYSLIRAQNILGELMVTLDTEAGEFARKLFILYEYIREQIAEANIRKDTAILKTPLEFLQDLRDTWATAVEKAKADKKDGVKPQIAPASIEPMVGAVATVGQGMKPTGGNGKGNSKKPVAAKATPMKKSEQASPPDGKEPPPARPKINLAG